MKSARKAFSDYVAELQREIHGLRMDIVPPDFAGAIKGLKTLNSMQDRLDTALANGKVAADQQAFDMRMKLVWVDANAAEYRALQSDLQQLAAKPFDDFKLAITARIDTHKKAEAERMEAERARIRQEEEAKARAETEAKLRAEQLAAIPAPQAKTAEKARPLLCSRHPSHTRSTP